MALGKRYGEAENYEKKLARVMERFGIEKFDWNWDRHCCWVTFTYHNQEYRFDHSVQNAQANGQKDIRYGSDAFAQLVLGLEDLARLVERGIYDLQHWVEGMKALPAPLPSWAIMLGMNYLPQSEAEIMAAYRDKAKTEHPDGGGSEQRFKDLTAAKVAALKWLNGGDNQR